MATKNMQPAAALARDWPEDGLESIAVCPVCGAGQRELLYKDLRDRTFLCAPGEWSVYHCCGCGSAFLDPRPNVATIGLAYSSYFTHSSAASVEQAPRSGWRRFRTAQRNGYLNKTYGYQLSPAATPLGLSRERRQRFDKYVAFLPYPGKGARVLDIGCGNGRFLMQMRLAGWEVFGVEPDPKAAAQAVAAGLDVRVGLVADAKFPAAHFDAVTMSHVLEHLHEPVVSLRECHRILKPGGMISIATPNLASIGHRLFGSDWFALQPPTHLVLFTPDSLRRALRSAGFEPEAALRSKESARAIFRRSVHIQKGHDPMKEEPSLSLRDRLRSRRLAAQADRESRARPELGEELVVLSRKV